jgi:hypothetical protein
MLLRHRAPLVVIRDARLLAFANRVIYIENAARSLAEARARRQAVERGIGS